MKASERDALLAAIGANIRHYRITRKMTQRTLAEKADLSVSYVSLMEGGVRLPAVDTLVDIAKVLEVRPERLMP